MPAIIENIFKGERGPRRDVVLLNAAPALIAGGAAKTWKDGIRLAAEAIDSGAAMKKLEELRRPLLKQLDRTHILARIIESKKKRLQAAKMRVPEPIVKRMAETAKPVASFREALEQPDAGPHHCRSEESVAFQGSIKCRSRSGIAGRDLQSAGACAISVVTEEDFFQGDLAWVGTIREAANLPVLRKDFVYEPFQVYETRAGGASAILFIVAMLQPGELKTLISLGQNLGLDVLVEVHDETELGEALEAGASIIGVNNRELKNVQCYLKLRFASPH